MEFEGNNRGMSVAEAEDEVVRFLQRQALLDEGGLEGDMTAGSARGRGLPARD